MRTMLEKLKHQKLFTQIFVVMVVSIIAVSLLTALVSIRMSEQHFMNTFSITNSKIINQLQTNFESYNYALVRATNDALLSGAVKSFLSDGEENALSSSNSFYNMGQQMKRIESNLGTYEAGVIVSGVNGRIYSSSRSYWRISKERLGSHIITANSIAEPKRLMYHYDSNQVTDASSDQSVIVASRALTERNSKEIYCIMYIAIREFDFRKLYSSFTAAGNDVAILDSSGVIVSSNRSELIGEESKELLGYAKDIIQNNHKVLTASFMDKDKLVLAEHFSMFDFYLVNLIDKKQAITQMTDAKTIAMISIFIVFAALIFVFLITRKLTRSLSMLVKRMSTVTKNNFGNYIKIEGSYETRELGQAYNYMLDELHDYVERLTETQREQRNAELAALQMQINPHFLYNTLASVKFLVMQGSKEKASDTINSLINLLQNTISNVSETITMEEEMTNTRNYVQINHVRYGERIKVSYFIAPNCLSFHLPKLVLQPFIENAFFHAFNEKQEGYIYVLVSQEGEALICEVIDNGDGMDGLSDSEMLPHSNGSRELFSGIGIRNVHDRIKLLYGQDYGVTITSKLGEGTKVRIKLPLLSK